MLGKVYTQTKVERKCQKLEERRRDMKSGKKYIEIIRFPGISMMKQMLFPRRELG